MIVTPLQKYEYYSFSPKLMNKKRSGRRESLPERWQNNNQALRWAEAMTVRGAQNTSMKTH